MAPPAAVSRQAASSRAEAPRRAGDWCCD